MHCNKCKNLLPFEMTSVPEYIREKAEDELGETEENRVLSLTQLKKRISGSKDIGEFTFEDDFLIQFLRHSKFKVDAALNRLHSYVSLMKNTDWLLRSIPEDMITKETSKFFLISSRRNPEGCVIFSVRFGMADFNIIAFQDFCSLLALSIYQITRDPVTQISGIKAIFDFSGMSTMHYKYCTPKYMYLLYDLVWRSFPLRWKEIHMINTSFGMKIGWAIFRTFLSSKMKSRYIFHSDLESLHSYLSPCILPSEYGGILEDRDFTLRWMIQANKDQETTPIEGKPNYY